MYHVNEEVEILHKLGILVSTLRSPYRMISSVLEVPKPSGSDNSPLKDSWRWDDEEDSGDDVDVVFDRNSLLDRNGTTVRTSRASSLAARQVASITPQEALRWKLLCLCSAFLVMGLSTSILGPTLQDIGVNTSRSSMMDFARIFLASGFGFLVGSVSLCILFTRLNAFLFLLVLLIASVPCTTFIIWVSSFNSVLLLIFGQGVMFGAIERGGFLMVHGLWKGNKRVFFSLYFALALGAALSSMLSTQVVYNRIHPHLKVYVRHRRAEPGPNVDNNVKVDLPLPVNITTASITLNVTPPKFTRPDGAVGIQENPNKKSMQNEQKRKEAEQAQKDSEKAKIDVFSTSITQASNNKTATKNSTISITTTTTTTIPTTSPTTPKPTLPAPAKNKNIRIESFNNQFMPDIEATTEQDLVQSRGRNRQPSTEDSSPEGKVQTAVKQIKNGIEQVKNGLKQVNTQARLAYMIIMGLTLLLLVPFIVGFCCCCIKWTMIADSRIGQLRMDTNNATPETFKIRVLSAFVLGIASSADAILLAFLPKFVLDQKSNDPNQNSPAVFVTSFWVATSFARTIFILRPSLSLSSKVIHLLYIFSILCCWGFHHFLEKTDTVLFIGLIAVALFSSNIPQSLITWHHTLIEPSVYRLSQRYLVSLSVGRMLGPILCAYWCEKNSTMVLFKLILVLHIVGYMFFVFLSREIHAESIQRQIHQLGGEVSGKPADSSRNGHTQTKRKGLYRALLEQDDDDIDLEMDSADEM